jgi:hypothetical protein
VVDKNPLLKNLYGTGIENAGKEFIDSEKFFLR